MKTIAILATALLISTASFADSVSTKRTLTFRDSFGRVLSMPMKMEEAQEELPFNHADVLGQIRAGHSNQIFDVSGLSNPENGVDDIPASLRHLISK